MAFAALAACPATQAQQGQPCGPVGTAACETSGSRLLTCTPSSVWAVYSDCGPTDAGCVVASDGTIVCDTSRNTEGHACAPTSEGKARCEPVTRTSVLRCDGGVLQRVMECPGGCAPTDGGLLCSE